MKNFTRYSFQQAGTVFARRGLSKILLSCSLSLMPILLFSQEKTIEKANLAYKYKQYAEAADLYEAAIAEKKGEKAKSTATLNLKTKLAYCYRMNNKIDRAEKLYAEIVEDERAKAKTYLYYGEALMCNGKYEEAKKWFRDYQLLEPNDKQAALLAANCDKIQYIEPYFPYVDIQPFAYNSDADDNAPVIWQNGIVFSSDRKQGVKFMKEKSGWTGRDYLDLYFSVLQEDGQYGEPRRFSAKLSEVNKNTGNASFSSDGKEIFFTRNDNVLNKKDTYMLQLFSSQNNNGNGKWKKAEKLPFCSPNYSFMHPAISPNGKELFFATNRKGEGGVDLWVSKRKPDGWGKPENLGPTINTSANEGFPFVDENGRLYFCSKGHPGYGGFDIFFSERDENGNWKAPQNLGLPINSPLDDISIYMNINNQSGMFTSSRGGGDDDIFFFKILPQPDEGPIADIVPVSNEKQEKYVNQKPSAAHTEESAEEPVLAEKEISAPEEEAPILFGNEKTVEEIKEETSPSTAPSVPGVPPTYQPNKTIPAETLETNTSNTEESTESHDPAPDLPFDRKQQVTEGPKEDEVATKPSDIFFELPVEGEEPIEIPSEKPQVTPPVVNSLFAFQEFMDAAYNKEILTGKIYRIDGATFDPNVWQLTPRVSKKLNDLISVLRRFPAMQIEISAHTETLGPEAQNLDISKHRANMAIEYMVKEGISPDRIKGIGYGEAHPLNHCEDGVTCSMEEHLYNQRLEVRVVRGIDH